ncbi:unnamed protein product [marine sediment metagenome]|uniref:Uncharacterized protein n=1 Tax=marine sediment metagenome TaxID=412755 RepID=X0W6C8_9ZZZZ
MQTDTQKALDTAQERIAIEALDAVKKVLRSHGAYLNDADTDHLYTRISQLIDVVPRVTRV